MGRVANVALWWSTGPHHAVLLLPAPAFFPLSFFLPAPPALRVLCPVSRVFLVLADQPERHSAHHQAQSYRQYVVHGRDASLNGPYSMCDFCLANGVGRIC